MVVNQGYIYWVSLEEPRGSEPGYPHPYVVIQDNVINRSRIHTVVVSQVSTVDKAQLGEYIGSLTKQRINQILAGMRFLQRMTEHRETGEERNGANE